VLQYVAVCCSVLQCVAVCCSVQIAYTTNYTHAVALVLLEKTMFTFLVCCSELRCVAGSCVSRITIFTLFVCQKSVNNVSPRKDILLSRKTTAIQYILFGVCVCVYKTTWCGVVEWNLSLL